MDTPSDLNTHELRHYTNYPNDGIHFYQLTNRHDILYSATTPGIALKIQFIPLNKYSCRLE